MRFIEPGPRSHEPEWYDIPMRLAVLIIFLLGCTFIPPSFGSWEKPSGTEYEFKMSRAICDEHCMPLILEAHRKCFEGCMAEDGWVLRD